VQLHNDISREEHIWIFAKGILDVDCVRFDIDYARLVCGGRIGSLYVTNSGSAVRQDDLGRVRDLDAGTWW